jgi:hypothetical protein
MAFDVTGDTSLQFGTTWKTGTIGPPFCKKRRARAELPYAFALPTSRGNRSPREPTAYGDHSTRCHQKTRDDEYNRRQRRDRRNAPMIPPGKSLSYLCDPWPFTFKFSPRLAETPRFDLGDSQWMPFTKRTPAAPERPYRTVFRMTRGGSLIFEPGLSNRPGRAARLSVRFRCALQPKWLQWLTLSLPRCRHHAQDKRNSKVRGKRSQRLERV